MSNSTVLLTSIEFVRYGQIKPSDTLLASLGVLCIFLAFLGDSVRPISSALRVLLAVLGIAAITDVVVHQASNQIPVSPRPCLPMLLLLAGIGFGSGFVIGNIGDGRPHWSRFGWDFSVILRARHFSPHPENTFPLLPGAVFLAVLLSAITLIDGDCPGFIGKHLLLFAGFVTCGVSTAAWLITAVAFERDSDAHRAEDIEQFLSDSDAPVPSRRPGLNHPPMWLRGWNWLNVSLFFGLIASIIVELGALSIHH